MVPFEGPGGGDHGGREARAGVATAVIAGLQGGCAPDPKASPDLSDTADLAVEAPGDLRRRETLLMQLNNLLPHGERQRLGHGTPPEGGSSDGSGRHGEGSRPARRQNLSAAATDRNLTAHDKRPYFYLLTFALFPPAGFRPLTLRPRLSTGLPFSV